MTSEMHNYSLEHFKNILFNDFHYEVHESVLSKISEIALEVGSPQYIKTPVFKKEIVPNEIFRNKGKKKHKNDDTLDGDWCAIKPPTSISAMNNTKKSNIDIIMTVLNKLTTNTYDVSLAKIKVVITSLIENENENEMNKMNEINKISNVIFDIVSTNIFYSHIYAKLFTVLVNDYAVIKATFEQHFNQFLNLFNNIEYADPNKDYDKFCEINKINIKRKALSTFFINLMDTNVILADQIKDILKILVCTMQTFILEDNRKSEVDELVENIAIMYRKDLFDTSNNETHIELGGITILDFIKLISKSKVSNYKSLTNKAIFKCMDLLEI